MLIDNVETHTMRGTQRQFWLFVALFFAVWTARAVLYREVETTIANEWARAFVSIFLKLLLWIVPVWGYLRYVERVDVVAFLRLNRPNRTTLTACILIIFIGIGWEIGLRIFGLNRPEQTNLRYILTAVVAAGILEEILFRGFVLNQLRRFMSWPNALLISSVLFVLIHIPGWIIILDYDASTILRLSLHIFFLPTLILGWLVKRTDSLYPSILLHMINNWV